MLAVLPETDPGHGAPRLGEVPDPQPGRGEVVVEVAAAGLNRADLLQLRGLYPPPPGESPIPGLECAGTIAEVGKGVDGWRQGRRVIALVAGGAHAQRVAVPAGQLLTLPDHLTLAEAAALPEAAITAWTNLRVEGGLRQGETVLITGATGGIGTFAVQLARELGARVLAAGRAPERLARLGELGAADWCREGAELPERVRELTGGRGVDLVLDLVGGEHLPAHLSALAEGGRLVLVGLMAGSRAEVDLAAVLRRRLRLVGSVLRARSRAEKARLVAGFASFGEGRLRDGRLRPVLHRVFPFRQIAEAYASLAQGGGFGKIVVAVAED